MKERIFYILVVFKDKNKMGTTLKQEYKRKGYAERIFNQLVKSGKYECVTMRKNEEYSYGISSSGLYKIWEVA